MNILVSACLLGIACRYDGKSKPNQDVVNLAKTYNLIPFCPECYGGLPTPRLPAEQVGNKVLRIDGADVTKEYQKGADEAVKIAKMLKCEYAILKSKSPSCGIGLIHNGSFDGGYIEKDGITAIALKKANIKVITENEISKI